MRVIAVLVLMFVAGTPVVRSSDIQFWSADEEINVRVKTRALLDGRGLMRQLEDDEFVEKLLWQGPGPSYIRAKVDPNAEWTVLWDLPQGKRCDDGGDVREQGLVRGNFIAVTNKRELFFNITNWDVQPVSCSIAGQERNVSGGICRDQFVVTEACLLRPE